MSWHPAQSGKCSDYFTNNNTVIYSRRNYNPADYNKSLYKNLAMRQAVFGEFAGNIAIAKQHCLAT